MLDFCYNNGLVNSYNGFYNISILSSFVEPLSLSVCQISKKSKTHIFVIVSNATLSSIWQNLESSSLQNGATKYPVRIQPATHPPPKFGRLGSQNLLI